jgi:hypothetical protein
VGSCNLQCSPASSVGDRDSELQRATLPRIATWKVAARLAAPIRGARGGAGPALIHWPVTGRREATTMEKLAKIFVIPVRYQRSPVGHGGDAIEKDRRARWLVVALLVGALGLFWGGVVLSQHEDGSGVRDLPMEARRGLYAHTLYELDTVCRDPAAASGSLRDHCIAQAHFVLQLPECVDACQRAAAFVLPHARR